MAEIKYQQERMYLFQAAGSAYGIVVATTDFKKDLQALYAAYRLDKAMLPALEFRRSPWKPQEEIWIVKVAAADAAKPPASPGEVPPPAIDPLDIQSLDDLGL